MRLAESVLMLPVFLTPIVRILARSPAAPKSAARQLFLNSLRIATHRKGFSMPANWSLLMPPGLAIEWGQASTLH
jgi:hypothetical protein